MNLLDLPDEMILTIVSFTSDDPRELIKISHTCRKIHYSFDYSSTFKIKPPECFKRGLLLEKWIKRPIGTFCSLLRDIFASDDQQHEENDETAVLESKQNLLNTLYFSRLDRKIEFYEEVIGTLIGNATECDPAPLVGVGLSVLSIAVQIFVGQYFNSQITQVEKSLDGVFWWIPYFFSSIQGILLTGWGGLTLFSILSILDILRTLPLYKNTSRFKRELGNVLGMMSTPVFSGFIIALNSYLLYSIKGVTYSLLGFEMTNLQKIINSINYYISIPLWISMGVFCLSEVKRIYDMKASLTLKLKSFFSNNAISVFSSWSCYRLNCGPYSVLPLSLTLMINSNITNKSRGDGSISLFALGVSLAIFGLGHHSYLSFAPVSLATIFETIQYSYIVMNNERV